MINTNHYKLIFVILFVALIPIASQAQIGGLKKNLKKAANSVTDDKPKNKEQAQKNIEACMRYIDNLDEKEAKITQRAKEHKGLAAEVNYKGYLANVENLRSKNCLVVEKYEKRAVELKAMVDQAYIDEACDERKKDINVLVRNIEGYLQNSSGKSILGNLIGELTYKVNEESETNCIDTQLYKDKIEDYKVGYEKLLIQSNPYTYMSNAIAENNKEQVASALSNGYEINEFNFYGRNALIFAISENNPEMVKFLISKGADVNAKNKEGKVALDYHPKDKKVEIYTIMLDAGADLSLVNMRSFILDLIESNDFEFIKKVGNLVKFTSKESTDYYFNSRDGSEMEAYFANIIKSGKIGKGWDSVEAGMKDASLEANMIKAVNESEESEYTYTKMKIADQEWTVVRHAISGVILSRVIHGRAYTTTNDGVCLVRTLRFQQYYNGSEYGKLFFMQAVALEFIDCN